MAPEKMLDTFGVRWHREHDAYFKASVEAANQAFSALIKAWASDGSS